MIVGLERRCWLGWLHSQNQEDTWMNLHAAFQSFAVSTTKYGP